jgi:hypothetical protein
MRIIVIRVATGLPRVPQAQGSVAMPSHSVGDIDGHAVAVSVKGKDRDRGLHAGQHRPRGQTPRGRARLTCRA